MTTSKIIAAAGENLVEQAIAAGKIPASRMALYLEKMRKRPKATAKLLDELEPALEPGPGLQHGQAAPAGPTASGPSDYPKGWLTPSEVAGSAGGSVTFEDNATRAGAMSPAGL